MAGRTTVAPVAGAGSGTGRDRVQVALPFELAAARTARLMVAGLLAEHGCDALLVDDCRLVVHELVVNGVRHGAPDERGEITVYCRLHELDVEISVRDGGQEGTVAVGAMDDRSASGRGLAMVESLSRTWTVDRSQGTRVTALLSR